MPKISKVVDLTKVNRRHSEIVFRTSKCDALHLEIYTGITAEPGATAELYVKKPNGKIVSQACTMNDTVATIDVLNGATDTPGIAEGIVKITDSEGEYCTPTFRFGILDSFAHEDSIGMGGTGITAEQAAQIQANKTAIQTVNETIGNKNELPVGDANIIASINRIDSKTSTGGTGTNGQDGATFTPSVASDGTLSWTNDKSLPNPTPVNIKGAKGDKGDTGATGANGQDGVTPTLKIGTTTTLVAGNSATVSMTKAVNSEEYTINFGIPKGADGTGGSGSTADLSDYQKKTDNTLVTTDKTVVGAINEVKNSIDNKVDKINGKGLSTNDYTTEEKATLSNLKTAVGDTNSGLIKDVKDLKTNGVSQDNINMAIENYLTEHPVASGATTEQAAQIEANRVAIGDSNSGLIKEINNIKNTELQNLNTAILRVNETLGDKTGLPSGDANVIASINRIDSSSAKTTDLNNKVDKVEGKILTTNDYTNEEKQTVASLKTTVGDTSSGLVKDVKDLKTNGVSQDNINVAIENYLQQHPIQSGATVEQAAQIQANKTAIGDANSGLTKEVNNIKNTELQNLNTAIQTLETLVGVDETVGDKTGLPSGDANVIASINRIDSKPSGTVTNEQISTAVNNYLTEHPVSSGATAAQAAQIEANRTAIGDANSGLTKEVNDIKNIELPNLNNSIQTLETLMNSDNPLKKNLFFKGNKKAGKGCVVFITDDGHECDLNFREVFNKYNKKFCSAVIAGWVGTTKTNLSIGNGRYMNWEEIQTLQSEGHEILSHTFTHTGLDNNNEQDIKDITDALNEFKSHNINAESIVFPYNRASDTVKREVLNYHRAGIGGTTTTIQNKIPLNHKYYLRRVEARGSAGVDYTTNYSNNAILEAINNNELLIFMLHSHYEPQEKQTELVEAMVKFCINNNVDICTMSEALDRFENIIQLGGGFEDESSYWCLAPNKRVYTIAPVDVESLSLNKSIANVNLNETLNLIATITPDNASNKNVTWLSSNPEVATVVNGTVTALTLGECIITCTSEENSSINAKCTINVVESGGASSDTILLDNAIMWLDARDALKAIDGKWTVTDRIDNSKYLKMGGADPTLHENGALIMSNSGTSNLYNGTVDISKRNLTFFANFKKDTAVSSTTNLINLYDEGTAGSFIKINQTTEGLGIQIYTTWNKVHEVAIPEFSISNNCLLVIRLNGNTLTVNYNGNVHESTSETSINNFSQMTISFDKSSTFYSMYLYNTALTDEQIQNNINYEKTISRG